jgi:NAD(P)-dependent dehydrogenase (short-subunit alcohol dehydrogenase family)
MDGGDSVGLVLGAWISSVVFLPPKGQILTKTRQEVLGMVKGKCVFITGGANGIARACAKRFLQHGAKVTFVDIAPTETIEGVVADLRQYGEIYGLHGDVRDSESIQACVEEAAEKMGGFDVGINSAIAANPVGKIIYEYLEDAFTSSVTIGLIGAFKSMKYETAYMVKHGLEGNVINMSSINAHVPAYGMGAYCASKAGIIALSNTAALEMGKHHIRINCILPGFTVTETLKKSIMTNDECVGEIMDQLPLKRLNTPEDIGDAALFLASDYAKQITGASLVVDGGMQHTAYPKTGRYTLPKGEFEKLYC